MDQEYAAHWPGKSKNTNAANIDPSQSTIHREELVTKTQKPTNRPDLGGKVPNLCQHNKKHYLDAPKYEAPKMVSMAPTTTATKKRHLSDTATSQSMATDQHQKE